MFVVKTSKSFAEGAPNVSIEIEQYEESTGKYGLKDMHTAVQRPESTIDPNPGSSINSVLQESSSCEALVQDYVTVSGSSETYRKRSEAATSMDTYQFTGKNLTTVNQNQVGIVDTGTNKFVSMKEEPYAANEVVVCNSASDGNAHTIQQFLSYNMEKQCLNVESENAVANIAEIPEVYVDNIVIYDSDQIESSWDKTRITNNIQVDSGFSMEGLYQNIVSSELERKQLPNEQVKKLHISPPPQLLKKFTAEDLKAIGTTKEDIMKPCFGRNKNKKFTRKEDFDLQKNPDEGFNVGILSNTELEETSENNNSVIASLTKKSNTSNSDTECERKGDDDTGSVETVNESYNKHFANECVADPTDSTPSSRKRKIKDDSHVYEFKKKQVVKTAEQKKTILKSEDEEVLENSEEENSKVVGTTKKDDEKTCEPGQMDNDTKSWQDIDKCIKVTEGGVIEIGPISKNIIKDKKCVIEVQVESNLLVKQIQEKNFDGGLNRYCLIVSNPGDTPEISKTVAHSQKQVNESEKKFNLRKRKKTKSNNKTQFVKHSARKCLKTSKPKVKSKKTAKLGGRSQNVDSAGINEKSGGLADKIGNENENVVKCENESQDSDKERSESELHTLVSVNEENSPKGSSLNTDDKPKMTGKKKASRALKTDRKKETRKSKRSKAAQNYHTRITEEGHKIFSCKFCTYSTKASRDIAIHYYQHTDERPFQCEICGHAFKGPSNLANHKKQHFSKMYYSCLLCEKQFKDRGNYKQHMRRHIGDKKHTCKHCEMSFVTTSDLKKHQRVHTGEKPYKCDLCIKCFGDKSSLLRHKNLHTQRYRFECEVCGKSFNRRDLCITHVKNVHKIENHLPINKIFVDEDVSRNYTESEIITKLVPEYASATNEDVLPESSTEKVLPKIVKANIIRKCSTENISNIHIDKCSSKEYVIENVELENSRPEQASQEIGNKCVNIKINNKVEKVSPQYSTKIGHFADYVEDNEANHFYQGTISKPDNKEIRTKTAKFAISSNSVAIRTNSKNVSTGNSEAGIQKSSVRHTTASERNNEIHVSANRRIEKTVVCQNHRTGSNIVNQEIKTYHLVKNPVPGVLVPNRHIKESAQHIPVMDFRLNQSVKK